MIIANLISLLLNGIGNDGTIKLRRTMHELSSAICLHCSGRNDFDHHSSYFSDNLNIPMIELIRSGSGVELMFLITH